MELDRLHLFPHFWGLATGSASGRWGARFQILVLLACSLAHGPPLLAQTPAASEYQVKAAILFNLTKYVDWPAESFAETNSPIVIGILGQNSFGDDFKDMIEGKTINGRRLLLKRLIWGDDLNNLHVLFVSASEKKRYPEIMEKLKNVSVLSVGESDSFTQLGGMITLSTRDNKIRPQINLAAAERAHLKISSKLLNISEIVTAKPRQRNDP